MTHTQPLEGSKITAQGAEVIERIKHRPRSLWSWLLDTSIFFSFDASGARRHRREITLLEERSGPLSQPLSADDHFLVTGANSGLGFALVDQLMELGATVSMICRNPSRGEQAIRALEKRHGRTPQLYLADLTDLESLDQVSARLIDLVRSGSVPPIRCLVHNAGLLPPKLTLTHTGHEMTVGAHLIGPMRLTERLLPALASPARVILVSSGGMYTAPLHLKKLSVPPSADQYQGVHAYALSKRAQVELAVILHQRFKRAGRLIDVQSVHPGWADTPGVERSLKGFHQAMEGRLRSSAEGAEAITWLCALPPLPDNHFWFDWAPRSPYLLGKRPRPEAREQLWQLLCDAAGLSPDWPEAQ